MENILDRHAAAYQGNIQYDFDNNILLNWYPKRVLELSQEKSSLLELGLGHGYTTHIFSNHFTRHVVLEGSAAVIQHFKEKYPADPSEIIQTYFENFDTEERFEMIVMGFILEHVDDPLAILTRFKKFLAPEGKIFAAVPNAEVMNRRLGNIAGLLPDIQALSDNDHLLGHKRYYTHESFIADIKNAGYEIERMEGIFLKPFTSAQIMSLNFDSAIINALCELGIHYPELSCGMLAELRDAS